jgi:hypothetical protein
VMKATLPSTLPDICMLLPEARTCRRLDEAPDAVPAMYSPRGQGIESSLGPGGPANSARP